MISWAIAAYLCVSWGAAIYFCPEMEVKRAWWRGLLWPLLVATMGS